MFILIVSFLKICPKFLWFSWLFFKIIPHKFIYSWFRDFLLLRTVLILWFFLLPYFWVFFRSPASYIFIVHITIYIDIFIVSYDKFAHILLSGMDVGSLENWNVLYPWILRRVMVFGGLFVPDLVKQLKNERILVM